MVTVEDINGALKAALNGVGASLPGGGWSGDGPDAPTYPYAMFKAQLVDSEQTSGAFSVQRWRAAIAAYVPVGWSATYKPQDTAKAIWNATAVDGSGLATAVFRNTGEGVLSVAPVECGDDPSPVAHNGTDVIVLTSAVELLVTSDRSKP